MSGHADRASGAEASEKRLVVDFPTGERYAIPARLIAENRAEFFAARDHPNDERLRDAQRRKEIRRALEGDDFEIVDWAANEMSWEEVEPHAERLETPDRALDEMWIEAGFAVREDV